MISSTEGFGTGCSSHGCSGDMDANCRRVGRFERISRTSLRRLRDSSCVLARSAAASLFDFVSQNMYLSPNLLAVVKGEAMRRFSSSLNRSSWSHSIYTSPGIALVPLTSTLETPRLH